MTAEKGILIDFIILPLLYFVILTMLLLITDFISLAIVKNAIGKNIKTKFYKKYFHKVFLFTALSYVIGITVHFLYCTLGKETYDFSELLLVIFSIILGFTMGPGVPPYFTISYMIIAALSALCVNIIFNYFIVFRKLDVTKSKRLCASLIVSVMTAPYFYFVSFEGFTV